MSIRAIAALIALMMVGTGGLRAQVGAQRVESYALQGVVQEVGRTFPIRPLPGATVTIVELNRSVVSGANGAYAIGDIGAGTYTVRATAPGHEMATATVTLSGNQSLNLTLNQISSDVVQGTIQGTISESGSFGTRPLAGATVRVEPGGFVATTGAGGYYQITGIPAGSHTVGISAPGHVAVRRQIVIPMTGALDVTLPVTGGSEVPPSEGRIVGVVRADGNGVSGASIRVTPGNVTAVTDANGAFSLASLPPGRYTLHIRAAGYRATNLRVTLPLSSPIDAVLVPTGEAKGRDRDDDRYEGRDDDDDRFEDRDDDRDDDRFDRHDDDRGKGKQKHKEKGNKGKGGRNGKGKGH